MEGDLRVLFLLELDRISFRMLCILPSFNLLTGFELFLPRFTFRPLDLELVVADAICTNVGLIVVFGGLVFLLRFSPAEVSCARGLGGEVDVPSWMVSTVRRGCFLGRPRFLLMGVWTVRLSVFV